MSKPIPTRREKPSTPAAGGPGVTRREDAGTGTGAVPTRHESVATAGAVLAPDALPVALAARLTGLTLMPMAGGEAHLLRVRDSAYPVGERVLKVYFPQIEPNAEVWVQLASIRSRHVVDIVETGTLPDGRFYELMEYLPHGSLRQVGAGKQRYDTARVTEMVRQLAAGLGDLHGHGITHRDLKPENVLLRGDGPDAELVLTDFGLSRRLDASSHFTTGARTSAYAAPEAWSGHVSPARDWWSLGIMVLELVTGQQPFQGLDERMIQKAVTTKPVPVDAITDPRLNRLCSGLLVSDETKRWRGEQVREWLAGGSPAVPDRRVLLDVMPFEFDGQQFLDPEPLAVAMAHNWRLAARRYGLSPSPSWTALTTWLHQFDDPGRYPGGGVERRLDLLGELESSTAVPDIKLVRLLAELNPKQPPTFREVHVDAAALRELARNGQEEGPQAADAHEIVSVLWDGQLLEVLARFEGGDAADLARIGAFWSAAVHELRAAAEDLRRNPRLHAIEGLEERPAALAAMLELAAGGPRGEDWVRQLHTVTQALQVPVEWFGGVVQWAGSDPARAYAALHASRVAQAEAQQTVIAWQAAEQARLGREQAWAEHERGRLAGQGTAVGQALGGVAVLAGLWLLMMMVAVRLPAVVAVVLLVIVIHAAAEFVLAQKLAADYHPTYSLLQYVQAAAGRVGSHMRWSPGRWVVGIIVGLVVLGFVAVLVPVAAGVAAVGHVIWAVVRHQRWSTAHEQDQRRVLSQ